MEEMKSIIIYTLKGELSRKKKFASFYAECATEFKSDNFFFISDTVFLLFALLHVNYVTAITREFSEAETRLSQRVVKIDRLTSQVTCL